MRIEGPNNHQLRDRVHLGSFLCNLCVFIAILAVIILLQGSGILNLNSERLAFNTLELIGAIFFLTFLATFLVFEFFLIGIPLIGL